MSKIVLQVLVFIALTGGISAQVSIHIESLPASTPNGIDIFLAGNINGWNPGDPAYMLDIRTDGDYWIDISSGSGQMEFKFTRGTWETVEGNESGNFLPNRTFTFGSADTIHLSIQSWEDLDGGGTGNSTANEQVQIWDSAMYIPQLNRYRRIWIYLPQDYATSTKNYPVLYMHDGQNIFDASTSFIGEWEVDETLTGIEDNGEETAIVVAIDNDGVHRIDEYSPFVNTDYGGGEGDDYLDFIIHTLKPRVDSTFRTLSDPGNTGIMGSSMGGLISHYAHFRNPEIFGRVGSFSPAYWFSDSFYTHTVNQGLSGTPRLYLLAGALETNIAQSTMRMYDTLLSLGFASEDATMVIQPDGEHSEWFWAREFEEAFMWMFNEGDVGVQEHVHLSIEFYPNPTRGKIHFKGVGIMNIDLYGTNGNFIGSKSFVNEGDLHFTNCAPGLYFVNVFCNGQRTMHKLMYY